MIDKSFSESVKGFLLSPLIALDFGALDGVFFFPFFAILIGTFYFKKPLMHMLRNESNIVSNSYEFYYSNSKNPSGRSCDPCSVIGSSVSFLQNL